MVSRVTITLFTVVCLNACSCELHAGILICCILYKFSIGQKPFVAANKM